VAIEAGVGGAECGADRTAKRQAASVAVRVGPQRNVARARVQVCATQLEAAGEAAHGQQRRASADDPPFTACDDDLGTRHAPVVDQQPVGLGPQEHLAAGSIADGALERSQECGEIHAVAKTEPQQLDRRAGMHAEGLDPRQRVPAALDEPLRQRGIAGGDRRTHRLEVGRGPQELRVGRGASGDLALLDEHDRATGLRHARGRAQARHPAAEHQQVDLALANQGEPL
jgi:hypothetical protein